MGVSFEEEWKLDLVLSCCHYCILSLKIDPAVAEIEFKVGKFKEIDDFFGIVEICVDYEVLLNICSYQCQEFVAFS